MRKIDKTKILSTKYKEWEANLEKNNQNHGKYNSSKNEHYVDVIMNLLHVQGGLCAYTEMRLCNKDILNEDNWDERQYLNRNPQVFGQLDHFDPGLKGEKAWLWDNFFFIETDVNTKVKGKAEVDNILKPDAEDYNVDRLLEYDPDNHIFFPHSELEIRIQERIQEMILILGINYDPVIDKRKEYLEDKLALKRYGLDYEVNQFPTAFAMCAK